MPLRQGGAMPNGGIGALLLFKNWYAMNNFPAINEPFDKFVMKCKHKNLGLVKT